jgi:hypothetical protein
MNKLKELEHYITLGYKGFPVTKHSSLQGAFVSYEENEVLRIWPQGQYLQHCIFLLTYEQAQKPKAVHYTRPKRLPSDKTL